jgi:hypothetical protein
MALRLIQGQSLADLPRQAGKMGVGGGVLRLFQSSLVDHDGAPAEHYEYDSFGNVVAGDTSLTRHLFTPCASGTTTRTSSSSWTPCGSNMIGKHGWDHGPWSEADASQFVGCAVSVG